jgi:small nuclear ribonucleoprotein (snRNP)-like protein
VNKEELNEYLGQSVVVDTAAPFIYIGTLHQVGNSFIALTDVDVHHVEPGGASKEVYALTARKHGVSRNRLSTKIRVDIIASISLLEDVIEF